MCMLCENVVNNPKFCGNLCLSNCGVCKKEEEKSEMGDKALLLCPENRRKSAQCEKFSLWVKGKTWESEQVWGQRRRKGWRLAQLASNRMSKFEGLTCTLVSNIKSYQIEGKSVQRWFCRIDQPYASAFLLSWPTSLNRPSKYQAGFRICAPTNVANESWYTHFS